MADAEFIPGLELSHGFFVDLVKPLMARGFPDLPYSAALIGSGSEVLGFDTPMSTDHHWGPRIMIFLRLEDYEERREDIRTYLGRNLPPSYRGYSTNFTDPDPNDNGVQHLAPPSGDFINHRVELYTIDGFFRSYLNLRVSDTMTNCDWLSLPSQKLRSIIAGGVFHDDLSLGTIRERLSWYPQDVWLYNLGCAWARIGQEEHLMGRAGYVGDETGSVLIGARLIRDIMRIAFLLEREYPPYPKWFGTAFSELACAPGLQPNIDAALHARNWQERQSALSPVYEGIAEIQRSHGVVDSISSRVTNFWGRPFLVIHGDEIAEALFSQITDTELSSLAQDRKIGSIDLISDNSDLLENEGMRPLFQTLYGL